jgi:diacylglycerol kinase (ATP)
VTDARAWLILNPRAGTDAATDSADAISRRLRGHYRHVETVMTEGPGDGEEAARRALDAGCETLFVGGGDGSLNEVVNGVASVAGALARVTFGVIPLGTGNDFAAALGIPDGVDAALDVLLEQRAREIDLGRVNGRVFANISGGGFIAEVSEAVTPQMKSIAGRLAYLVGGAQALWEFEPVQADVSVAPGGPHFRTRVYAFAVCNSRLIGGGKLIAPHAVIDDGLLDLCIIEEMPAMEFLALLRQVAQGTHTEDPRVRYLRGAQITLTFERPIKLNTDGEVLEAAHCDYQVLPKAARFFAGESPFLAQPQEPAPTPGSDRYPPG